jgi:hypothetical protein
MATGFYTQLLGRLEEHYSMPVTSMDHSQLVALDANNADFRWLKDAAYRCLLYLGDLARYSVDIGGKPHTATSHYLHAISLDPTNGTRRFQPSLSCVQRAPLHGNRFLHAAAREARGTL